MGRLDDWYGVEKARRIRAQQRRRLNQYAGPFDVKATSYTSAGAEATAEQLSAAKAQLLSSMKRVIAQLKSAAIDARSRVAAKSGTLYSPTVKLAYVNTLTTILNQTIPLREKSMQDVLDGKLTPERWMAACQAVANGIIDVYNGIGEDTVVSQWAAAFKGVASDLADIATTTADIVRALGKVVREVPKQLEESKGLIVFAALGLLALVGYQYATAPLRLLPSKATNGYNGLSTHRRRR